MKLQIAVAHRSGPRQREQVGGSWKEQAFEARPWPMALGRERRLPSGVVSPVFSVHCGGWLRSA